MKPPVVGVAGCGAMGLPMAKALHTASFETFGFDVRPANEFDDFASRMICDPQDFARTCDTVICVVRDIPQVLDLCFEKQNIFKTGNSIKTFVLSSTVSPRFVHQLRNKLPETVALIDAPMSGAPIAAQTASLTFMVGASKAGFESFKPLADAMGTQTFHVGPTGAGMTAKVLNNFVAAACVVTVRQALAEAARLGLDKTTLLSVMDKASGQNWFASNIDKIDWSDETYDKANTIGILEKDLSSYIDALQNGPKALHIALADALKTLPPVPE